MGFEYPVAVGLGHRRQGTATRIRAVPPRNIPLHMQDAARRGGTFAICCCCCARRRAARVWAGAARSLHAAAARERRAAGAGHACDAEAEPAWRQQVASRARPEVRCARRARPPPHGRLRLRGGGWWWPMPFRRTESGEADACALRRGRVVLPEETVDGSWTDGWPALVACDAVASGALLPWPAWAQLHSFPSAGCQPVRRRPAHRRPLFGSRRPAGLILRHFTLAPPIFTTHPSKNPSFACLQSLTW